MNDAKRYLLQLHALDHRISSLQEELERRRARMTSVSIRYDKLNVQSSGATDPMADYAAAVDELLRKITDMQREYSRKRGIIEAQVMELGEQNRTFSEILALRYISDRSWIQISDQLGLTYTTVVEYHGRALRLFAETFNIGKTV